MLLGRSDLAPRLVFVSFGSEGLAQQTVHIMGRAQFDRHSLN